MTQKSISAPYGNYGGVSNDAHYVPPVVPDFVPCPPTVVFSTSMKTILVPELLPSSIEAVQTFIANTSGSILLRYLNGIDPDGLKTFVMYTCDNPNNTITYKASSAGFVLDLLRNDGGTF